MGGRSLNDFIVWSTLPHFLCVPFVFCPSDPWRISYAILIIVSSIFSVAWHMAGEPSNWVMYVDYTLATLWAIMDIIITIVLAKNVLVIVIVLNTLVLVTNKVSSYTTVHGYWHLFSSLKAICIAYMLGC